MDELSPAQLVRDLPLIVARLAEVESRQERDAQEVCKRLDEITGAIDEMIRRSKDQYLGWRIVGLVVAFGGAGFLAAANLVSY